MVNDECFWRIDIVFVDSCADDDGSAFIGLIINIKEALAKGTVPHYRPIEKKVILG